MKRIQYDSYGGPETMKLEAFELKAPGTGEVAVKVEFAAINPIDWKVRNGYLKMVTGKKFPRAMGSDFSGIVTAVGAGVTRFKIGDPVFGMAQIKHGGALGEVVIAPQTFVARRPDSVSFEDAACLATPGVTAWNGLVDKAALKSGSQVFINGCTGAVGEAGVSLRTIYRDIADLQGLGAQIDGEPGFGYVLQPGFLLPPLMFSEQEIQALALGAQWVSRQTDDEFALAARDALAKIGAVLPSELQHKLDDSAFHVGRRPKQPEAVDLRVVRQAMRDQHKLSIVYRDPQGAKTTRIIWPIGVGFFDSRRIIAGWCEMRKDFRSFRADRIEKIKLRTERYPGRRRDLVKQWRAQVDAERRKTLG